MHYWQDMELWAEKHRDSEIRALGRMAFDRHCQVSMNELRLEYDWETCGVYPGFPNARK